jgi:glycerol-3-phosphate dehydrogenase
MMMSREQVLEHYRKIPDVSVLVVGAGVNGIGAFRDLALQGVDVLLVDKADFASGASAASSHMLHGGIRYLENGEFRLVREALTERNRMLHNAPHYSKPLPTVIPIFKWFSGLFNAPLKFLNWRDRPAERGAIVIKLGLMMYDFFTRGQQGLPTHRLVGREESHRLRPHLNSKIVCTAQYYDAWMPYPERICLELVMQGEESNPNAHALNYCGVVGAKDGQITLHDEVTGTNVTVRPKLVINAAGPWIDLANGALGKKTNFIGGTKGSHILVDHSELHAMTGGSEMFFENKDGRITLFFNLYDKVLIGTTDIRADNPDAVECTDAEIDYMLDLVSHVFPDIKVEREQIVFAFTGIRPLPSSSTSTTGQISRDHLIQVAEPTETTPYPVYSMVSGKWTTYRAFAEQVADKALYKLRRDRKISTEKLQFGGGKGYPTAENDKLAWINKLSQKTGIDAARIGVWFDRYGTYAAAVADYCAAGKDAALENHPGYSHREIAFLAAREKVIHLDDLILRRSLIGMLGETTGGLLLELAQIIGSELGWSADQVQQEAGRCAAMLVKRHRVLPEKVALPELA